MTLCSSFSSLLCCLLLLLLLVIIHTYAWHLRTDDIILWLLLETREERRTKIDEKTYDALVLAFYLAMLYIRNYLIS